MTAASQVLRRPLLIRFTPQMVVLFLVAAVAAAATAFRADGMWEMAGTMGLSFPAFVGMWTLMMAAMMLPSVAPFASMYARTVRERRSVRLASFALGYMLFWSLIGAPAYGIAWLAGEYTGGAAGTAIAVGVFAACGLYQLTSIKYRCLSHCRSPLGHVLHFASYRGALRDLRVGFEHGYFCVACCWSLMLLFVAFGVMNVPAMVLLAAVVATEKLWRWGTGFSKAVGVGALGAALAVAWVPGLAPGLTNEPMQMSSSEMSAMAGVQAPSGR